MGRVAGKVALVAGAGGGIGGAGAEGLAREGAFSSGVLHRYTSETRLSRDEFFRACGRNLWRFLRLLVIFAIVAGIVSGLLFAARATLVKKAGARP